MQYFGDILMPKILCCLSEIRMLLEPGFYLVSLPEAGWGQGTQRMRLVLPHWVAQVGVAQVSVPDFILLPAPDPGRRGGTAPVGDCRATSTVFGEDQAEASLGDSLWHWSHVGGRLTPTARM